MQTKLPLGWLSRTMLALAIATSPSFAYGYHFFGANIGDCRWVAIGPGIVDFLVDGSSTTAIGDALLTEVGEARAAWNDISTAQDVLGNFTKATVDFTDANLGVDWGIGTLSGASDGQNEVVLDETGDIMRTFGLNPTRVNGFAPTMRLSTGGTCRIVDAFNLLNGTPRTDFDRRSTTVHEFGHIQGLAHSSVGQFNSRNNNQFTFGFASPSVALQPINILEVPTMHPFSSGTGTSRRTPEEDDAAALSVLYPASSFLGTMGGIAGTITSCSDDMPLEGVNVRAVNSSSPSIQVSRYSAFDGNGVGRYLCNRRTAPGELQRHRRAYGLQRLYKGKDGYSDPH